jgi:2-C-methyl-D-erythritol 4-phosphate cytidylyltransferase
VNAAVTKRYLKLLGLEIALHSLNAFLDCQGVDEIVVVVADEWRSVFEDHIAARGDVKKLVKFTNGGAERQDSVCNGLAKITSDYAAVHDAARPLVTEAEIQKVIADAKQFGAALLAVKTKATIKQAQEGEALVAATPNRSLLWEAHTPQVIKTELLRKGFKNASEKKLEVTDDVSLVEFLDEDVKLTEGEYTNLKVTTPEDIAVAETILRERGFVDPSV